jgi:hypothetical protein
MHVLFIDIWKKGPGYNSNPTVFMLVGIGILPKYMLYLLVSGRQDLVVIPCQIPQYLY